MSLKELQEVGHRKLLIHLLFGSFWRIFIVLLGASMLIDSIGRSVSDKGVTWPEAVIQVAAEVKSAWMESIDEEYEKRVSALETELETLRIENNQLKASKEG